MEQTDRAQQRRSRTPWWLAGVAAVAIIAIIAVVGLSLELGQEDESYPPDSAEAALQAYFAAWDDGNVDAAYDTLSTRSQARVPRREFRAGMAWADEQPTRVWVDERIDHDDHVVLRLTMEFTWDGLFGPERQRDQRRISMVREDDAWKIDTPLLGYHPW